MRGLIVSAVVLATALAPQAAVGDFIPIDPEPVRCQSDTLHGVAYSKAITWESSKLAIGGTGDQFTYSTSFKIRIGKQPFQWYTAENLEVVKDTEKCLAVKMTFKTPYPNDNWPKRRIVLKTYDSEGNWASTDWYYNKRIGEKLR